MSLITRLVALERTHPPREPWCILVKVCTDGTTAYICWPLPAARTDRMTLTDYRARYGDQYLHLERWTILTDTEPHADQLCEHW